MGNSSSGTGTVSGSGCPVAQYSLTQAQTTLAWNNTPDGVSHPGMAGSSSTAWVVFSADPQKTPPSAQTPHPRSAFGRVSFQAPCEVKV